MSYHGEEKCDRCGHKIEWGGYIRRVYIDPRLKGGPGSFEIEREHVEPDCYVHAGEY